MPQSHNTGNKDSSVKAAGAAGALAGAALGATAAVLLSNETYRKKLTKLLTDVKRTLEELAGADSKMMEKGREKVASMADSARKKLAKKS